MNAAHEANAGHRSLQRLALPFLRLDRRAQELAAVEHAVVYRVRAKTWDDHLRQLDRRLGWWLAQVGGR